MILTRNLAALQVVRQPRRQSGQHIIQRIYRTIQGLEMLENKVDLIWIMVKCSNALTDEAKKAAKKTTQEGSTPCVRQLQAKSSVINTTMAKAQAKRTLPDGTGAYSKRIDAALPGRHTRRL
ncbi:reverse transcriptase [Paraphaeosphaeria sporulosa]